MVTEKIFRLGYVRRICVVVIAAGVCLLHASVAAAIDSHSANDRSTFKVPIIAETDVRTPVESNITTWIEVISWTPRLIHIHGLLSPDECDYMVTQGNKTIQRSTVVGDQGEPIVSEIRTSKGTWLDRFQDSIVTRIDRRIAELTMIPEENGEDLQMLEYRIGEEYRIHPDWFDQEEERVDDGLQRVATVLMYLTNVTTGGETIFPYGKWNERNTAAIDASNVEEKAKTLSKCARGKLHVRPKRGDAVFFYSLNPKLHTTLDSYHASCPVIRGVKWSATKWFHVQPFRYDDFKQKRMTFLANIASDMTNKKGLLGDVREFVLAKNSSNKCRSDNFSMCRSWALAGLCDDMSQIRERCCKSCEEYSITSGFKTETPS